MICLLMLVADHSRLQDGVDVDEHVQFQVHCHSAAIVLGCDKYYLYFKYQLQRTRKKMKIHEEIFVENSPSCWRNFRDISHC